MKIIIPVDGDDHFDQVAATIDKMGFKYKAKGPVLHPNGIQIEYIEPLDLYFLGAQVIADAHGILKTGITT